MTKKGFTYRYKCKECGAEHFKSDLCPVKKCDGLCVLKDGVKPVESKRTGWIGSKGRMW
jgi:hypothetical protein